MLRLGCVLFLLALCGLGAAPAAPWKIPPVDGELEGEFTPGAAAGAPTLKWKLTVRTTKPRERDVELALDGPGARVRLAAMLDPAGEGTWRLTEATFDLAVWWPVLAARFFPAQAGLAVAGTASLGGDGAMEADGISTRLEFEAREGTVADAAKRWSANGIAVQGRAGGWPAVALSEPVRVRFREATIAGLALRDGTVEFTLAADGVARVSRAECGVFGGRVALAPFAMGGAQREVRTALDFTALNLGALGKFLPAALADARGLASGRIELGWEPGRGLTLAAGSLRPGGADPAVVRLTPTPGFLTERLPVNVRERFDLLPAWLGPVRKLFSPPNPAYPLLRAIELGESSLEVTSLEIGLRLDGDDRGRTAHIVALTRPTVRGTAVESVRFEFNVTGPLADFARLLAEERVNLRLR